MAFALVGTSLSPFARKLILKVIRRLHGRRAKILVVLDPKQDAKALAKGKPHHIEKVANALMVPFTRVVPVYLPEEHDPGSMERPFLREYLRQAAKKQGVQVRFDPPTCTVSEVREQLRQCLGTSSANEAGK
jgi:hypothetical protein